MINSILRAVGRQLLRRPLTSLLDIGGLALGISTFIILGLFVRFETSFDSWFPSAGQVYLVRDTWTRPDTPQSVSSTTMGGLLDQLRADYHGLPGTRVWPVDVTVQSGGQVFKQRAAYVDASFFQVFDWKLKGGDGSHALTRPDSVVLTESAARKYFGTANALGRNLTVAFQGRPASYTVTAIAADIPRSSIFSDTAQSELTASMMMPIRFDPEVQPNWYNWGSEQVWTFLRFPSRESAKRFEEDLPAFMKRHAPASEGVSMSNVMRQSVLPLTQLHLSGRGDRLVVVTLALMGLLTLMIAAVNYTNLATARGALRAREVAMRKVVGATRGQLIVQLIGETIVIALLASLVGLALAEMFLPVVNAVGGISLGIHYVGADGLLLPLLVLALLLGIAGGAYPALFISAFRPAVVLASAQMAGGGRKALLLREMLVGIQFAAAIAFAIVTAVLLQQANHVRHANLGFRPDNLVLAPAFTDPGLSSAQRSTLLQSFGRIPEVRAVTQADTAPGDSAITNAMNVHRPDGLRPNPTLNVVNVGPNFFGTYGMNLLAGRALGSAFGADEAKPGSSSSTVLNRSAVTALGLSNPAQAVGTTFTDGDDVARTVTGIVEDARFHSPREQIAPTMYLYRSRDIDGAVAAARFVGDPERVIREMHNVWGTIAPAVPFEASTAQDNLARAYWRADEQRTSLFAMGSVIAVLIGCVGLYSLASFAAARRVREIGIRKTFGASTRDVAQLLIMQMLRPVIFANLIAWPLAYFVLRAWLAHFDERVDLSPFVFLLATAAAVGVAAVAIAGRTLRLAATNPGEALRYE